MKKLMVGSDGIYEEDYVVDEEDGVEEQNGQIHKPRKELINHSKFVDQTEWK